MPHGGSRALAEPPAGRWPSVLLESTRLPWKRRCPSRRELARPPRSRGPEESALEAQLNERCQATTRRFSILPHLGPGKRRRLPERAASSNEAAGDRREVSGRREGAKRSSRRFSSWETARRHCGCHALWRIANLIRCVYRQRTLDLRGDMLVFLRTTAAASTLSYRRWRGLCPRVAPSPSASFRHSATSRG
jgi:hypothetical protein